jgi:hypothetical protein
MSDLLNMEFINSLPQPLWARKYGNKDWWWPINDMDVVTGLFRIDVCGLLEAWHFDDAAQFKDDNGVLYEPEQFYSDDAAHAQPSNQSNESE